ncbi:MAG: dCTP deaminase [Endomicrobiaceae bacterium]|nr:dCTP deaminase [Endomicrobiaceae bacterium]
MYLSDKDIKLKLDEMNITCESSDHPFVVKDQIQPSSIDLRLSNVFWEPLKKIGSIDLRKRKLLEIDPTRYWKKKIVYKGEYITLNPGKLLLCRTYEKFSMPKNCSGKIEGRSSFSRMGLGIHCTGDFINPGYRGHMPLQLFNYGPNPIKIFPYLPICQLILVQLSSMPSRFYGEEELQSKYMDDDGGPSFWWKDKRIKILHEIFRQSNVSIDMEERILSTLGSHDSTVLARFSNFFNDEKTPKKHLENASTALDCFKIKEKKLERKSKRIHMFRKLAFPTFFTFLLGMIFTGVFDINFFILLVITVSSALVFTTDKPAEKYYVDK